MMKVRRKTPFILCLLLYRLHYFAHSVAINNKDSSPGASAMPDVKGAAKGILIPKMIMSNRESIISPVNGLMTCQANWNPGFCYNTGTTSSPVWIKAGSENLGKGSFVCQSPGTSNFNVPNGVTVMEFEAASGGGVTLHS
jgi:hypothetical protein